MQLWRLLVTAGAVLIGLGLLVLASNKLNLPLGRLPGDILVRRGGYSFYFPLTTCLIVSLVISIIIWIFRR